MTDWTDYIYLEQVSSTNDYATELLKSGKAKHLQAIRTDFQSAGKGQKGSSWESEWGKNLLFSVILLPEQLEADKAFFISVVASLAITDALHPYVPDVKIKWPNDIYYSNRKLGGILIENSIGHNRILSSVIGIGLNINQSSFPAYLPNPVSLAQISGKTWQVETIFHSIYKSFKKRIEYLEKKMFAALKEEYTARLLGYKEFLSYFTDGGIFRACIIDVRESGEIILEQDNGKTGKFGFKEVRLLET